MHLLENIKEAFRSIHSNLLRTVLTALIVSIGIMSLVGILTAIDAIKYSLNQTFASLGANSFEIKAKGYTNRMRRGGVQGKVYPAITYLQAKQYKEQVGDDGQVGISAFIAGAAEVKANGKKTNPNMNVVAGDENYLQIQNYNLARGRAFSSIELENGTNVAIVGKEITDKLFPNQSPVDKYIYLLGRRFQVVGELEKSGSTMGGGGADRMVLIPLETGNQMPRQRALTYDVKTATLEPENLAYLTGQATGIMRAVRHDQLGRKTASTWSAATRWPASSIRCRVTCAWGRPGRLYHPAWGQHCPDEYHDGIGDGAHPRNRDSQGPGRHFPADSAAVPD
uniref:ABC transporter permease n=1 Tax=Hymenobacter cellulosilyticus TaxID=2932248 RepID=UPI002880604F|nr:ABC transporter permease [Hymenobacter cellulosilyticus]